MKLRSMIGIKSLHHSNSACSLLVPALGRMALLLGLALLVLLTAQAQVSVTTQHNDISRTGANTNETILTPLNVNTNTFGKLFSQPVDGHVYAQPLYLPGITMGAGTPQAGTTHNVLFIATQHDSVYAFDADNNGGANGSPLWQITLLDAAHGASSGEQPVPTADVACGDVSPEYGIASTPVIDPTTNTMYVVGKSTLADTAFFYRLHALDVTTGKEKFGGPVTLSGSVSGNGNGSSGGTLHWDPKWQHNRAGLLLLNGIVYIGFGSHCDNGPWHGWILAYSATTLTQTGAWSTSPNSFGSGIWMGGTGLAADVPTGSQFGRMFTTTGNGFFDATAPNYTNSMDYGDSILRLDLTNGSPKIVDDFTPHDQSSLNSADTDQASGGVLLLPDSVGGGNGQHQLIQLGKSGRVYVLDRENLGGYTPSNTTDPEEKANTGGLWGSPAYWSGKVYIWGINDNLKLFNFANGTITSSIPASKSTEKVGTYSPTPSISANGNSNGIVWSMKTDNFGSYGDAILYAHDASNVATLLFSSAQNPTRDTPGASLKFVTPTVVNGKVYVGTKTQVSVYGLLTGIAQTAAPVISPAGHTFTSPLQVTITDTTPGAFIYYTTDGSTPTTTSTPYTAPITVSTTQMISAIATASGFLQSSVSSQTYTLQTQTLAPTFNPPPTTYTTVQTITISDGTPNSTIYYTIDGTTPSPGVGTTQVYSAPVTINSTTTIKAIATSAGLSSSPISSGLYTISLPGATINFSTGFSTGTSTMSFNGSTGLDDTRLQLTSGLPSQAGSAFFNTPVNIQSFTTDFTFQLSNAGADGITFTIQGNSPTTIGQSGGGLGYGPDHTGGTLGIAKSVAIKFDTYSNEGEGPNSTGLYLNGVAPTIPSIDLTSSGIDLHSGSTFFAHIVYDGALLALTITDGVTGKMFSTSWQVDIPGTVGGASAYAGFTGGTGGLTSSQKIATWSFSSTIKSITATPSFNPPAGVYLGTQSLTISDATPSATIYYTTDGSTPTTSSAQYTGPLAVTTTQTIKAIAAAPAKSVSAVGAATYTIESQVATPTFSPTGGTYPSAQLVTISTTSPGATIYYTMNGTTPTTASTQYAGPITVSATQTIQAIAIASGFFDSNVASATYTITSGVTVVNLGSGFTPGAMVLNGNSALNGTRLRLTDGGKGEVASSWYISPVNIQQFTTNFSFQITGGTNPTADGFAFVIQGGASSALGPGGGGLGYGPNAPGGTGGLVNSVAVKFDLYNNAGEGADSTGLYVNGASPTTPAVDMTSSGVNLHTTDIFNVQMSYDGSNLTMTIVDATTNATFTRTWAVNIPATIGGNTAYVGFTGGTGGSTAIQEIIGWTMTSSAAGSPTATPTFSPAAGTYTTAQTVTISDVTSGATIYYTTNGTTPTTTSTKYIAPITVSSTQTIQAIAVATGFTQSGVGSATYTITPVAATPTFSPAAGTYTTAQTVTISDVTSGATIYYTANGTTPTTASTKYTAPITVSSTQTIQAIAVATGLTQSAIGSATYTITPVAATPTFSPAAGTYTTAQTVTISDVTSGATIYYTTNGTTPTTASTQYTAPIAVSSTQTIQAIAVATGFTQSGVGSAAYTITPVAATPTFLPAAGTYTTAQTVTISDTTSGATIYYTTNGTTPTTASTKYTAPITVSSTQTIQAIAVATGFTQSAVGSATYTITPVAATPTFSPAAGTYTTAQTVTISDATSGATIYYTTNGTTPTTASTRYIAPITVSSTQTIQAIAVATGFTQSAVGSATYTITSGGGTAINLGSGFTPGAMVLNGNSALNGTRLRLTDGGKGEVASSWYISPVNIQQFTTNFSFQITGGTNPTADGFAFVIQGGASSALGPGGGGLGYGPNAPGGTGGLVNSVAVKFDLYNNAGEGADSTGLYVNGASPTTPAVDMTSSGVNLHTTDIFNVQMSYDGSNLTMTIVDATTNATFTRTWAVNIPATIGGNTAYVGFTGGTGGSTAIQEIIGWTMTSSAAGSPTATPTFSPAAGTYTTAQTVTISDVTSGATIYYTTNGTTPTTTSTKYIAPITVSSTQTIQAIAVATGFTQSGVGSATYTITSGGGTAINLGSGFTPGAMVLNGNSALNGTRLRLTDGGKGEVASSWYISPVNIQQFTTNFSFQITGGTNPTADGFAFVIQGGASSALGPGGGGLGYGPNAPGGTGGLVNSVAVKFDLYNNAGEGADSTGLYVNGASPTTPAVDMTSSGVNLHTTDIFNVQMSYDGSNMTMTIVDATTNATFTRTWAVNIPATIGGNTAYVGFTGGTGGSTAIQEIIGWTM